MPKSFGITHTPRHNKRKNGKKPIEYATEGQDYAQVTGVYGACHFKVTDLHNNSRRASLSGNAKTQGKVIEKSWVLIEPMSSNLNGEYRIVFLYNAQHIKCLEKEGILAKLVDPSKKDHDSDSDNDMSSDEEEEKQFVFEGQEKQEPVELKITIDFINSIS